MGPIVKWTNSGGFESQVESRSDARNCKERQKTEIVDPIGKMESVPTKDKKTEYQRQNGRERDGEGERLGSDAE